MPESRTAVAANVRSNTYFVARTEAQCWHCGLPTRVLALAMPPDHETLDPDVDDRDAGLAETAWQCAGVNAFLFYMEYLPDAVRSRLSGISPYFRLDYSEATLNSYWANHCEHCGSLLGDHELHCEFDGAFMPFSVSAAANIQLLQIQEPIEARVVGYAYEPEYFRCMSRS